MKLDIPQNYIFPHNIYLKFFIINKWVEESVSFFVLAIKELLQILHNQIIKLQIQNIIKLTQF